MIYIKKYWKKLINEQYQIRVHRPEVFLKKIARLLDTKYLVQSTGFLGKTKTNYSSVSF